MMHDALALYQPFWPLLGVCCLIGAAVLGLTALLHRRDHE